MPPTTTSWPLMNACCNGVRPLALWLPGTAIRDDKVVEFKVVDDGGVVTATPVKVHRWPQDEFLMASSSNTRKEQSVEVELEQKLEKFSLLEAENSIVDIAQDDTKVSKSECQKSLFGKIIRDRSTSLFGVKRTIGQIWKIQGAVEVRELSNNFFQFIFDNVEDLQKVAYGNSWVYDNQYFILREWQPNIRCNHPCFDILHLWVNIFNVPFHWQSPGVGLKIGNLFKGAKNVTITRAGDSGEERVIRILAAINVKEPLLRCANVRLGDEIIKVSFKYEKLVNLCYYCGTLGHLDKDCKKRKGDIAKNAL
ncbi:Unknown protein [Striga hermonthica]|uniref:CCHC-type domain-containing protein n=1 Tax=Striga hermonthica TaxID=68872 RepID=A0A9N7NJ50_STRHE|nr:Unknown protein [Striga hermonthica]